MAFRKAGLTTLLVPVFLAAGCALEFPPSAQSGVFACNKNPDCSGGYECINGKCTLSGSAQDGGTPDGGSKCSQPMILEPAAVPQGIEAPLRIALPPNAGVKSLTVGGQSMTWSSGGDVGLYKVVLPATLAAGSRPVHVTLDTGCADQTLEVDAAGLATEAPDPPAVTTKELGTISVHVNGTIDPGGFVSMYLVAAGGSAAGTATRLAGVHLDPNNGSLSGEVPRLVKAGKYDLVLLAEGKTKTWKDGYVVDANPLRVHDVRPHRVAPSVGATRQVNFVVRGSGFTVGGSGAISSQTFVCQAAPTGAASSFGAVIDQVVSDTELDVHADVPLTADLPSGSICQFEVTASDGRVADGGLVSILGSTVVLGPTTTAGPPMHVARTDDAMAVAHTDGGDYLVVVGGDLNGPSSELAPIEAFGQLGPWRTGFDVDASIMRLDGAGLVAVGRVLYLLGGLDTGGASPYLDTVYRASVLDGSDEPEAPVANVILGISSTLKAGTWRYAVAPYYDSGQDPYNPIGNGVASRATLVVVPAIPGAEVSLHWEPAPPPAPGPAGYLIYRTRTTDLTSGLGELVAIPDGGTRGWIDDGSADTSWTAATPARTGDLTPWVSIPSSLPSGVAYAAVAVAPPILPPGGGGSANLVVVGGEVQGGVTADAQVMAVADPPGQPPGWSTTSGILSQARGKACAWVVTAADSTDVTAGVPWIVVGPGDDGGAPAGDTFDAMTLKMSDGTLTNYAAATDGSETRVGASCLVTNGQLVMGGGDLVTASTTTPTTTTRATGISIQAGPTFDLSSWSDVPSVSMVGGAVATYGGAVYLSPSGGASVSMALR